MNESDIHLKLLANVPIQIDGIGEFQLPTIREVIRMGESKYNAEALSPILISKDNFAEITDEISEMADFQILLTYAFQDESFRNMLFAAFSHFLSGEPKMLPNGVIYFDDLSEDSVFTEEKYEVLKKVVKMGNLIPEKKEEEEYKAGNERARKFMEKLRKSKAEAEAIKKKNEKINLHSMISAVGWRLNDIDKVLNKTIYQLYDAYYRFGFIDNFNFINTGIYTGNIDGSKIKLPDINWVNKIN